ncbi:30S ribosomal protein S18 [candidate division KSB1 bacterium]|nr:30S ribosomal protein S18 [candidate division Zixibacteria bacterium]NIR49410.1 30S ribosomal protein S18 [candidate division KSB1 bacterium]NIS24867.1 30S ribosomal protein S18 [candidate division KSB1 bacterium]NIU25503.1 30S ribosomal protein S18 [candidate division KSB1 bacterium]
MVSDRNYRGRGGRRFYSRPRSCQFCSDENLKIDYKDIDFLRRFVMEDGRIRPRRQTGNCAKHQRAVAQAVKRARHIALLPYSGEVLR